ncbi:hypothetical protein FRC19_005156 [Serendipita sp. 401]|nr:hypothetical protein FRC19_005156 [Serendipita sp. 401]KAG9029786.1 hypothetical protein FS842_004523 [Serendipita sp. 407]
MIPLEHAGFTLDISGVAGFFGGDEVLSAMNTIHFYKWRKYLGWYNSPGSYTVAKKYGRLANARFWKGLFPGGNTDINKFLGFDGEKGPSFFGAHSGTRMSHTSYIAHLLLSECESLKRVEAEKPVVVASSPTRKTADGIYPTCSVSIVQLPPLPEPGSLKRPWKIWIAIFPILASVGCAVTCGYFRDWYCFSMILLGMFSSGFACYAAGRGELIFSQPSTADGSPAGDGILYSGDRFVVLTGKEESVCAVTRGGFSLNLAGESQHHRMGVSSLLLVVQFLLQLLLIPQGTLFGQIMFLVTFVCSWLYNCYLSSIDKEEVQRNILMSSILGIDPSNMKKYTFTKRTTAVVFLLLVLQPQDKERMLNKLLPNKTDIWKKWKEQVLDQLDGEKPFDFPSIDSSNGKVDDHKLLENLYAFANNAYEMYEKHTDQATMISSNERKV